MKLFEVLPDDDGYDGNYLIDATHKWSIPGVSCPVCGFIGSVPGIAYPRFRLPSGIDSKPYEVAWPVAPARIRELCEPFQALVSKGFPVPSGTEFGPLNGKASGKFGDFAWLNDWTPLISENALGGLLRYQIKGLEVVSPEIRLRSKAKRFSHLELSIDPLVHVHDHRSIRRCTECGMPLDSESETIEPYRPIILKASFPKDLDLARTVEAPTYIIASERLVRAARELDLTDIKFEEVELR